MSADNFLKDLESHVGQKPNKKGRLNIGANVVLTKSWGDTVYISTIRSPVIGKGLARFAIDEITAFANQHNVTLTVDCSGVNDPKKGLSTQALKGMFERRGFIVTRQHPVGDGCEMKRLPDGKLTP